MKIYLRSCLKKSHRSSVEFTIYIRIKYIFRANQAIRRLPEEISRTLLVDFDRGNRIVGIFRQS